MKILTLLLLGFSLALHAEVIANVTVQKATPATLEKSVQGFGSIDFDSTATRTISLESQARVTSVKILSGQSVKKGEIIATIAPSESDASALRLATISVEYAKNEKTRVLSMKESALATNADMALASQNLDKALQTQAELSKKLHSVMAKNLRSPIDGVVQSVMIKNGDIVSPQTPLITIAKAHQLVATLGVEPSVSGIVTIGQKVLITPYSSRLKPFSGSVLSVSSQIDPKSRLVNVRVGIPFSKDLIAGTTVIAQIITGVEKGIVLPSKAIITKKGVPYCFVVEKKKAHLCKLKIGFTHNGKTLVTAGIHPNDSVITLGNYECEDGMSVNVVEKIH
jgi:RND family efflux transporter MFP subunit